LSRNLTKKRLAGQETLTKPFFNMLIQITSMRNRIALLLIPLFLTSLITLPCSSVKASVENVTTSASITAQPENVLVGQYVQISVQIYPPPPTPEDVFENLTVLFGNPLQGISGHYSFIKGPSSTDANGFQSFSGLLTDSGYWSIQLHFPGQFFANNTIYYQPGDWHIMVYVSPPPTPSPSSFSTPSPTISPSPPPTASPSPTPSPTPLPQEFSLIIAVTAVIIAVIVVGAALLAYFKKRKH
jgi:hypothetical protein